MTKKHKKPLASFDTSTQILDRGSEDVNKLVLLEFDKEKLKDMPTVEILEIFYRFALKHRTEARVQADLYKDYLIDIIQGHEKQLEEQRKHHDEAIIEEVRNPIQALLTSLPEYYTLTDRINQLQRDLSRQHDSMLNRSELYNNDELQQYDINEHELYLQRKFARLKDLWELSWNDIKTIHKMLEIILLKLGKDEKTLEEYSSTILGSNFILSDHEKLQGIIIAQETVIKHLEEKCYYLRSSIFHLTHPEEKGPFTDKEAEELMNEEIIYKDDVETRKEMVKLQKNLEERDKRIRDLEEGMRKKEGIIIDLEASWSKDQACQNQKILELEDNITVLSHQLDELQLENSLKDSFQEINKLKNIIEEQVLELDILNKQLKEYNEKEEKQQKITKDARMDPSSIISSKKTIFDKLVQTEDHDMIIKNRQHQDKDHVMDFPYVLISLRDLEKDKKLVREELQKMLLKENDYKECKVATLGKIIVKFETEEKIQHFCNRIKENESIKDKIDIQTKDPRGIKLIIFTIPSSTTGEELQKFLYQHVPDIKFIRFQKKIMKKEIYHITVEMDFQSANCLLRNGYLNLGLSRCRVRKYRLIPRCFRCQRFNHTISQCDRKNQETCQFCAGHHYSDECAKKQDITHKCINCMNSNRYYKTHYETNHSANSTNCTAYRYYLNMERQKFNNRFFTSGKTYY